MKTTPRDRLIKHMEPEKLQILKEFISKQRKFKIEGYENTHTNIDDFIKDFHNGPLNSKGNIYLDNGELMKRGLWRSVVDTMIACEVHHGWAVEDVLDYLAKGLEQNELQGHFCSTIQRIILQKNRKNWGLKVQNNARLDWHLAGITMDDLFKGKYTPWEPFKSITG